MSRPPRGHIGMKRAARVQRRRSPGWRAPEGSVIVDRSSRWGNPFTVEDVLAEGKVQTSGEARAVAVHRFSTWLDGSGPDEHELRPSRAVSRSWMLQHLETLAGLTLVCTCPVDDELPCHADELARRAAERVVYAERAQLVANFAARYDAAVSTDPAEPLCPAVVYVRTPAGQLSWHIADLDLRCFEHVKAAELHQMQHWDGPHHRGKVSPD